MGNGKIIRDGYKLKITTDADKKRKIAPNVMIHDDPNHNQLNAYGSPIGVDAAELMIGLHWKNLKIQFPNDYDKKYVAFTVGKETLLSILSQQDCEAVRFYMARWDPDYIESENPYPSRSLGDTVVVVGAKYDKDKKIVDIGAKSGDSLIVSQIKQDWNENTIGLSQMDSGEIREMVPPYTIGELRGTGFIEKAPEEEELAKAVSSFFSEE